MNENQQQVSNPFYSKSDDELIDLKRYISLFLSNWYWFAISIFVSISIAYGINRWSEKVYTISSTLLIKDDQSNNLTDIFPGSEIFRNQQQINNEIGILKSFNLNYRVMSELPDFGIVYTSIGKRGIAETRLYKNSPFEVKFDSLRKQIKGQKLFIKIISPEKYKLEINDQNIIKELSFGERFNQAGYDFSLILKSDYYRFDPNASNRYHFYFLDPVSLANQYRGKLSIAPVDEESSLLTLRTTGYVPQQEADYLNTLMRVYLEFGLEYKNQNAAQTLDFIEEQLGTISDSLRIAESNLEGFRLANNLIDISKEGSVIRDKLEQIDAEKTRFGMQRSYYEYLKVYIKSKNENSDVIAPSIMGVTDQLLIKLVDQFSELQKQKRQLSMNLLESAEPFRIIENNISDTRKALSENINDGLAGLDRSIEETDIRLNSIERDIKKLPSTERQMINIQRKFDINNTVYTFLLEKRAEAGIAKASNVSDHRIIDLAGYYNSSRIRPKEKQNLTTSLIIGLIIPLIMIILIDYLNNKIIDKKDIERVTRVPIIGYINHNDLSTEIPVSDKPGSTLSESFRSVRTNLKYFTKDLKCPVISITSTITSEGKTFISSNLAAIFAMSGKKTLLVGLDLRKPRIHKIFGVNNETGISNFLIGEAQYNDIIKVTNISNLFYATSGPVPPNPAELIESDSLREFIEKAKTEYDCIIIDTPPVAIVTDALLVSGLSDIYLFVVRQRYSSKNTLELIEELSQSKIIKNIGIIINDISISGYYGYGLRYGYSMGYGYNYGYNYYSHLGKYGYANSAKGYYTEN